MITENREDSIKYIQAQLNAGYIALGTHNEDELEVVKEVVSKQVAKHPFDKGNPGWHIMCCPSCDRIFWSSGAHVKYEPNYCEKCGQKMDWSDWRLYTNT